MKTLTVRADIPESRELHLALPEDIPAGPAEIVLVFGASEPASAEQGRTLGDFLNSEFFGMWRDRTDITDSVEYSRKLREEAWRRAE